MTAFEQARALFQEALVHHNANRLTEAEPLYRRALALMPDRVSVLGNLAVVLVRLGRHPEARTLAERALAQEPGDAQAQAVVAECDRVGQGPAAALAAVDAALVQHPQLASLHNQRAVLLRDLGRFDAARAAFDRAVAADPGDVAALSNRAALDALRGAYDAALAGYRASLRRDVGFAPAGEGWCLLMLGGHLPVHSFTDEDDAWLARALRTPWLRPQSLAGLACARLAVDRTIATWRRRADAAWPERLARSGETDALLGELAGNDLLAALLACAPVTDPPLERLLCNVRAWLLDAAARGRADPRWRTLAVALALQCDANEFVWDASRTERESSAALWTRARAALASGRELPVDLLLAVAASRPLATLDGAARLLDREWPAELRPLLERQVAAVLAEAALQARIPRLTAIDPPEASAVRRQYEEHPYPRWRRVARPLVRLSLPEFIAHRVPGLVDPPGKRSGELRVLNAGCGTGQQPIESALRLAQSRVLAVDLSRASLTYATRMARELDVKGIAFAQADLLRLGGLPDRFDLVESTGVLHHLPDPAAGLAVLTGLLAPGGVLRLAVYSQQARTAVVEARALIERHGWTPDVDGIRACRAAILALPPTHPAAAVARWTDFHTTSECGDLLFHPCEHRFDIAGLAQLVAGAGLRLIGFELTARQYATYAAANPGPQALRDFAAWGAFERTHPDFFAEMYTIWVMR